ncbi:MAG: methyl-accepting chemotaxis protein [Archangiaceae bacterium]|nr:methyl-accepting chemotaxis protein [Archangiaceae bacterium]
MLGSSLGLVPTLFYQWATLPVEGHDAQRFVSLFALAAAVLFPTWWLVAQRRVRTVRRLASEQLAAVEGNLIEAIKEVSSLPDWLRVATLVLWFLGGVSVSLGARLAVGLSTEGQLRIVVLALTMGPFSSVLVYLFAVRRARLMIELISKRVPAKAVLAALGGDKPRRVRTRLAVFTAIMVVLPAVMVSDASRLSGAQTIAVIRDAPRAEQADRAQAELRAANTRVGALAGVLLALAVLAAAMAGSSLADPMRRIADEANRISRGDLRQVDVVPAEDELWQVTSRFSSMQALLQDIIGQMQRAGISIGATTEQLVATSSKYESGAADQATSLNETSATTEELAQSARQISHNAASVSELAQKTLDAARAGQDSAEAFVSAVDRMKHDNHSISEAVTRLQKRVQQIGRIVEFITTVADRSDLLALSAELEGTKAGDVGRGFTLVAAEMRRLAENVIESTNEIEELIGEIREATHETVGATGRGMEHTESGTALAGAVSQSLESVVGLAQSTSDSVRAISLATQQQQTSTDQLAEAMADILGITQQSLAATKQVTSANHELITLSTDLKGLVEQFRVKQ